MNTLGARVSPPATNKEITKLDAGEDPDGHRDAPRGNNAAGDPDCNRDAPNKGWHHRGYLPHFDDPSKIQTITYRLADSLPQEIIQRRANEPDDSAGDTGYRQRLEEHLDRGYGACHLKQFAIAQIVIDSWLELHGVRYELYEWVVMPNHVHILLIQCEGFALADIVKGFKSFTAREINRALGRRGQLWQDYWDRYIRNSRHFEAAAEYVRENPVKAGLVACAADWPWSSAGARVFPPANLGARVSPPATNKDNAKLNAGEDTRAPRKDAVAHGE